MTKIVRVSLEHPLAEWAEKEEQVQGPEGARVEGGVWRERAESWQLREGSFQEEVGSPGSGVAGGSSRMTVAMGFTHFVA